MAEKEHLSNDICGDVDSSKSTSFRPPYNLRPPDEYLPPPGGWGWGHTIPGFGHPGWDSPVDKQQNPHRGFRIGPPGQGEPVQMLCNTPAGPTWFPATITGRAVKTPTKKRVVVVSFFNSSGQVIESFAEILPNRSVRYPFGVRCGLLADGSN
ncbi:hypothetical protein T484DRAFT_3367617 [Baffinella frigidus]|nr:hypothetical protein T484DRAFT_3367617 [Cryptophyta sp. CCMP2293]